MIIFYIQIILVFFLSTCQLDKIFFIQKPSLLRISTLIKPEFLTQGSYSNKNLIFIVFFTLFDMGSYKNPFHKFFKLRKNHAPTNWTGCNLFPY